MKKKKKIMFKGKPYVQKKPQGERQDRSGSRRDVLELATHRARKAGLKAPTMDAKGGINAKETEAELRIAEDIKKKRADVVEEKVTPVETFDRTKEQKFITTPEGEKLEVKPLMTGTMAGMKPDEFEQKLVGGMQKGVRAASGIMVGAGASGLLFKGGKHIAEKVIVGKSAQYMANKFPALGMKMGSQYATNTKSMSLTKGWLAKLGIGAFIASQLADLYGTFPFASFGKEETLQSISFPMNRLIQEGKYDEAEELLAVSNEIVNATPTISEKIPYVNVQKEFTRFIETQKPVNEAWAELLNSKREKELEEYNPYSKPKTFEEGAK